MLKTSASCPAPEAGRPAGRRGEAVGVQHALGAAGGDDPQGRERGARSAEPLGLAQPVEIDRELLVDAGADLVDVGGLVEGLQETGGGERHAAEQAAVGERSGAGGVGDEPAVDRLDLAGDLVLPMKLAADGEGVLQKGLAELVIARAHP